jgi:plasmid stabilization system protein ParE
MALEVIWSPRSLNNLEEVIQYLRKNWSRQVVKDFIIRMDRVVQLISEHPQIFRQVLAVFDTRQHPRKKKYS